MGRQEWCHVTSPHWRRLTAYHLLILYLRDRTVMWLLYCRRSHTNTIERIQTRTPIVTPRSKQNNLSTYRRQLQNWFTNDVVHSVRHSNYLRSHAQQLLLLRQPTTRTTRWLIITCQPRYNNINARTTVWWTRSFGDNAQNAPFLSTCRNIGMFTTMARSQYRYNIQIVTGVEVNIGNYWPSVGKILPSAGRLTKAPVAICFVSWRSKMADVKTIKYNTTSNCRP